MPDYGWYRCTTCHRRTPARDNSGLRRPCTRCSPPPRGDFYYYRPSEVEPEDPEARYDAAQ